MNSEIRISTLHQHIDQDVEIRGWVWNSRGSSKVRFVQLRDGSGFVQCVAGVQDVSEDAFDTIRHLTQESVVLVQGKVRKDERSPLGVEVLIQSLKVLQKTTEYPISPKNHGTEFLMDHRHLWLRSPRQQAILTVRHRIVKAIRDFFDHLGFVLVDAPIFTPNECEGSGTLFSTDYFGEEAYLSQSGQLYMEAACQAVGKSYCFGPTFRAENSNTRRHLTEFWMVEPEVAFLDLQGDMELAQAMIQSIVRTVLTDCQRELKLLERDLTLLEKVPESDFPRITYLEAIEILQKNDVNFKFGDDFGGGDETVISNHFGLPVFVTHYPAEIKPFYMKRDLQNSEFCLNMDLLAPEGYGEIIGGSQREESLQTLQERIKAENMNAQSLQWYLDTRRYGSVPHSGFGLGIERSVAWICGLPHVRETIPFPRMPKRLQP